MSYAVLAELPPVYGLFCAVSGPLVYTFLGSSRHISIGPVALVSLSLPRVYDVLYPDLLSLPEEEASAVRVHAALSIAFVSGVVLSALGLFRLGLIAHLIPPAVMVGFTNAAALAIGVSQIKEVLGLQGVPRFDYTWQSGWYVLRHLGDGQAASAGVGLGCIVFLLAAKQLRKRFMQRAPPAGTGVPRRFLSVLKALYPLLSLVLVIVTSLVARLLLSRGVEIIIVKDVPAGLPSPAAPRLDRFWTIVEHSLGVVLVAFMEVGTIFPSYPAPRPLSLTPDDALFPSLFSQAYAVAKKYALQEGYYLNVNRELLSLGAANLGASFFSSYPVSGSFSRSAVSYSAGTQTQLANAISAVCVMMVLSFFAQFFYYLPRATLGAIIEVALLNLLDFESMRREYRRSKLDAIVAFVTFSITLAFDTELGLLGGISASALLVYWMPRGGAFITRLYVRPRFRRHDKCSICVIDLPRLLLSPTWAQRRLTDYLKSARRSGGAAGMLVILSWHEKWKDEEKSGRDDKVSWEARRRNGQMDEHRVQAMIQRAMEAADAAGVPREMTTIVGLPLPGKSCQSADLSLLVTEGQRKVAENVWRRASSISLLAAYGEELMTDLLTR
jgi:MFS superfamily sulfate permease-like transporter